MNKMIKLPLFLGVVGAACATLLAAIYPITSEKVATYKAEQAAKAYVSMYKSYGVTKSDIHVIDQIKLTDDLYDIGCTSMALIADEDVKGVAYTCSFKGYGGQVDFQIGFANGKYLAFKSLKHGETAQGKTAMESLPSIVNPNLAIGGKLADNAVVSKSSYTGMPISDIVEVCKANYLDIYNNNRWGEFINEEE